MSLRPFYVIEVDAIVPELAADGDVDVRRRGLPKFYAGGSLVADVTEADRIRQGEAVALRDSLETDPAFDTLVRRTLGLRAEIAIELRLQETTTTQESTDG